MSVPDPLETDSSDAGEPTRSSRRAVVAGYGVAVLAVLVLIAIFQFLR